ncbi:hypothetical protein BH20CHL6_BH20CHL6_06820 [soil metagenome]
MRDDTHARIHIIGGPGGGKTTLARKLAQRTGATVHHLDELAIDPKTHIARPVEVRHAEVRHIASQPSWVTEGVHLGWTEPLLEAADVILWLDYAPWPTAARRIVVRFVVDAYREARRRAGRSRYLRFRDYYRHLANLLRAILESRAYYRSRQASRRAAGSMQESHVATAAKLAAHQHKVIHCRRPADVDDFLAGFD